MNYDCKKLQNAMQVVVDKCVASKFGNGTESKVRFEFIETDAVKPAEYLELAQKCKDLGLKVDVQALKDITGLQFISDEEKDVWTPEAESGEDTE